MERKRKVNRATSSRYYYIDFNEHRNAMSVCFLTIYTPETRFSASLVFLTRCLVSLCVYTFSNTCGTFKWKKTAREELGGNRKTERLSTTQTKINVITVVIKHHFRLEKMHCDVGTLLQHKKIYIYCIIAVIHHHFFVCCFSSFTTPPPLTSWNILVPLCVSSPFWIYYLFFSEICPLSIHTYIFLNLYFHNAAAFLNLFLDSSYWNCASFFFYSFVLMIDVCFFFVLIFFHLHSLALHNSSFSSVRVRSRPLCTCVQMCLFSVACGKKNNTLDLLYPLCFIISTIGGVIGYVSF